MKKQLIVLAAGIFTVLGFTTITSTNNAYAAVPPDSCFQFSAGSITNYYENEGNNPANPACPKNVDIPATIGGVPVTSLATNSMSSRSLTAITLPASLTSIGSYSLSGNILTSVTIPNGVTTIGASAFVNNQISTLNLASSVTNIDAFAFSGNQLTSLTIPNGVTTIGDAAFSNNLIASLNLPNTLTSLGTQAFMSNRLTTVTIPGSLANTGMMPFIFNQLTSVTLNPGVNTIGMGAFAYNNITSVSLRAGLTTIENAAFAYNSLESVDVPTSVNNLNYQAFAAQFDQPLSYLDGSDIAGQFATLRYVKLYVTGGGNPNGLSNAVTHIDENIDGQDFNGNGNMTDVVNIGGHVINPASTTVNYVNSSGGTLLPSISTVGELTDGTNITDYLVSNGPVVAPYADPYNPTPAELAAASNTLATAYDSISDSRIFTADSIDGYDTITPASPHSLTLASRTNTLNFVYSNASDDSSDPGTTDPQPGQNDGLADTGENIALVSIVAVTLIALGVIAVVVRLKKSTQ